MSDHEFSLPSSPQAAPGSPVQVDIRAIVKKFKGAPTTRKYPSISSKNQEAFRASKQAKTGLFKRPPPQSEEEKSAHTRKGNNERQRNRRERVRAEKLANEPAFQDDSPERSQAGVQSVSGA
jgi:hypothetical protein